MNIQRFGGRGARIVGLPKNKKKSVETLKQRIKDHKDKIQRALNNEKGYDKDTIPHWQTEIKALQGNIDKILRRYKK